MNVETKRDNKTITVYGTSLIQFFSNSPLNSRLNNKPRTINKTEMKDVKSKKVIVKTTLQISKIGQKTIDIVNKNVPMLRIVVP